MSDRLIIALEACASKLSSLGREFSKANFTDRHGDGPACLALAKHAREVLDESRTQSETAVRSDDAAFVDWLSTNYPERYMELVRAHERERASPK